MARRAGQKLEHGWTQLWMADKTGQHRRLVYGEDGRHIYGGAISPDGKYVLFTRSHEEDLKVMRSQTDQTGARRQGAPMALMRLSDAPTIGGESKALRNLYPATKMDLSCIWPSHGSPIGPTLKSDGSETVNTASLPWTFPLVRSAPDSPVIACVQRTSTVFRNRCRSHHRGKCGDYRRTLGNSRQIPVQRSLRLCLHPEIPNPSSPSRAGQFQEHSGRPLQSA